MSALNRAVKQLRWSIELRGLGGTASLALRRLAGQDPQAAPVHRPTHPFDTEHGVETGGRIGGSHLGAGHAHDIYNVAYQGTPPSRLHDSIRLWREATSGDPATPPLERFAFFDIGCGKGRAVMLSSQHPFREVAGVELDPALAAVAQTNLLAWARTGKARQPVTVLEGDATEVPLPALPCVFFLYNSFRAPVVRKMMDRLAAHALTSTAPLDLIYLVPEQAHEVEATPGFRKLWQGGVRMSDEDQQWDDSDVEDLGQIWRFTR